MQARNYPRTLAELDECAQRSNVPLDSRSRMTLGEISQDKLSTLAGASTASESQLTRGEKGSS